MKPVLRIFALGAALAGASSGFGQEHQQPPPAPKTLHVQICPPLGESVRREGSIYEDVASNFGRVFHQRKWPIDVSMELFGGGPVHDLELELLIQHTRDWLPNEKTYAAWTTLKVGSKKYDLGIIKYVYDYRAFEPRDMVIDNLLQGAANATADKIEPLLFPKSH